MSPPLPIHNIAELEELATLAESMRGLLQQERHAIARLDSDMIRSVDAQKRRLLSDLSDLAGRTTPIPTRRTSSDPRRQQVAALMQLVRMEAQANGLLIAAAHEALSALRGEVDDVYDQRAKVTAQTRPIRIVATI